MSLNSCQRARYATVSAPSGWVRLKWMLPSPTWPKAIGRMPGSLSVTPAVAADDKVGDPADRYRDVVLDRAGVELRLDNRLADPPERLGLRPALGDDAVR